MKKFAAALAAFCHCQYIELDKFILAIRHVAAAVNV